MNGSDCNCINLARVVQLLVYSELATSAECRPAFWKSCPGWAWEWFGRKATWFPSGRNSIYNTCEYFLRVGKVPIIELGLREGKIPAAESGSHLLLMGKNLNRAAKSGP